MKSDFHGLVLLVYYFFPFGVIKIAGSTNIYSNIIINSNFKKNAISVSTCPWIRLGILSEALAQHHSRLGNGPQAAPGPSCFACMMSAGTQSQLNTICTLAEGCTLQLRGMNTFIDLLILFYLNMVISYDTKLLYLKAKLTKKCFDTSGIYGHL